MKLTEADPQYPIGSINLCGIASGEFHQNRHSVTMGRLLILIYISQGLFKLYTRAGTHCSTTDRMLSPSSGIWKAGGYQAPDACADPASPKHADPEPNTRLSQDVSTTTHLASATTSPEPLLTFTGRAGRVTASERRGGRGGEEEEEEGRRTEMEEG